jgi:transposase
MMGIKARVFRPVVHVSLEDLVPADHFYRHVEQVLDLSFVREMVRDCYAIGGRRSIDPVVFWKLQLVMFFEGMRSERQLERVGSDRLSVRWYLGYDLHEPLPDHSSLTRIRERYGIQIFRKMFDAVVERCRDAGLVWGEELFADATLVEANADRDKMLPRFAVEAHLRQLFGEAYQPPADEEANQAASGEESQPAAPPPLPEPAPPPSPELGATLAPERLAALNAQNERRLDWYARNGEPDRSIKRGSYQRMSDLWVCTTDPDAVLMRQHGHGTHLRYRDHYLVDGGKARIILGVLVTAADVMENMPFLDMVWRACFRWQLRPKSATGDTTYGTVEIIRALEDAGIKAYMPITDWDARSKLFGRNMFTYIPEANHYVCPLGATLSWEKDDQDKRVHLYRGDPALCQCCPLRENCTKNRDGRRISRSFDEAYLERVHAYHQIAAYKKVYQKRKVWVEPLFGEAQQWHGLRRFRLRGLRKVNCEAIVTALGQNLKRLLSVRGWGRKPFPSGAAGIVLAPLACPKLA